MKRILITLFAVALVYPAIAAPKNKKTVARQTDREYWTATLYKIAYPVL